MNNPFSEMEDMDLVFIVLECKANIIFALRRNDKDRYGESMMLLHVLERELDRRGLDKLDYGPDFIGMAQEEI